MVADVKFPIAPITRAVAAFQEKFPAIAWRLYIEGQPAVVQQVLERRCPVGIMASLSLAPISRRAANSCTCPRGGGSWPIWGPSWLSCAQGSGSASCRWVEADLASGELG